MKNKSKIGTLSPGSNFKRPCWLALFISLGMMLVGYGVYYGMFPYAEYATGRTWQIQVTDVFFLVMVVGIFGFAASLAWWFAAAIASFIRIVRGRTIVTFPSLGALGLVTVLCLGGQSW